MTVSELPVLAMNSVTTTSKCARSRSASVSEEEQGRGGEADASNLAVIDELT